MSGRQVNGVWCTKDDVMHDLALATGGGLDVDDHCLVYGERPPPKPECDIDDEMKILFGGSISSNGDQKFAEPDLKGIMSMIRMVETEEDEDFSNPKAKPTDVIVISKLNPNVREFVPKSRASQTLLERPATDKKTPENTTLRPLTDKNTGNGTPIRMTPSPLADKNARERMTPSPLADKNARKETPKRITCPLPDQNTRKEIRQITTPSPLADNNTQKETPLRMTSSPLAEKYTRERMTPSPLADENARNETPKRMIRLLADINTGKETREIMTSSSLADNKMNERLSTPTPTPSSTTEAEINSLKDKILSKTAKDPYEHRRQKNAAIATLLRHFSTPPITKVVKEKPIKLYPPEFFERCKAADFKSTDDSSTEVDYKTEEPNKDAIIKETDPKQLKTEENNDLTPDVTEDLDDTEPASSYELVEQKESIAKVDEWLNGSKSPKKNLKPVIHAGPIAYKRKEVMSPSSTASVTIDKKISKQDDKAYVPSSYAKELRMKYEKNKIEANKSLNIWDNLEDQLKKKDEEIRKKSEQQD